MNDEYGGRPATDGDLDSIARLMDEVLRASSEHTRIPVRDFLQYTWLQAGLDLALDRVLVEDGAGEPVGYGFVWPPEGSEPISFMAFVHPAHRGRGIGSSLVSFAEERAAVRGASRVRAAVRGASRVRADGWDPDGDRLLLSRGYERTRTMLTMYRMLSRDDRPPEPPEGITLRPIDPDRDARGVWAAQTEAFAEHFGIAPERFEDWLASNLGHPGFSPWDFLLALDGDEVVALIIRVVEGDIASIPSLGTRPAWRGRGIASALLRQSFFDFAERGLTKVSLGVDAENATRAIQVYEAVGMTAAHGHHVYERDLTG